MNHDTLPTAASHPPAQRPVDVSVVIVNYNVREFLVQAVRSVQQASGTLETETWVVDNNSVDDSVAVLETDFPEVRLIANRKNVGFGTANNQAIQQANGRFILILNPDTIVQEDTLERMVAFMEKHPACGALGCQILNPDGSFAPESRRAFPTPEIAFWRMTGLGRLFPRSRRFGGYNMTYLPEDEAAEVDALSGSCMFVRREALLGERGAGMFDEDFFMYGEDLDLCFRIQRAGWSIWYTPDTRIIHYKGESTKKGEIRYVRLFYGAMLLFIEKHLDRKHSTILASLLRLGIWSRAALTLVGNTFRRVLPPLTDALLVYGSSSLMAWLRYQQTGSTFASLFLATVAPAYAVATVASIGMAGGYRRSRHHPAGPVLVGLTSGFLVVSAFSFFVEQVAFSRFALVTAFALSLVLLVGWRFLLGRKDRSGRRALLVGGSAEADRLHRLMAAHPRPGFRLAGYVHEDQPGATTASRLPRLGRPSALRDLVRIQGFDDIVFAARDVSNQDIIHHMRSLQDLVVGFRILSQGGDHLIGKAEIDHLSTGRLGMGSTEEISLRPAASRRLFEWGAGLLLSVSLPVLWLGSRMTPRGSGLRRGVSLLRGLPDVFTGKRALVGCESIHADLIPTLWNVKPGLFTVTNSVHTEELEPDDVLRSAWYYATHQGPGLDVSIIAAGFRTPVS